MYYCTNCHRVTPERTESCPYCNKFDRLRPAEEADECRLTELDALNASVMESLLKEANVPYIARPMMPARRSSWKPCLRRTTTRRMQTSRTRTKNRKMRTNNPHTNRGD